ncbi:MAG: class I SAM-dependent methyltransferase, partial [Myxococcales bacterium]|nr:class I SAM-dependent methyltransferase [Myxococcales bacterium]
MTSATIPSAQPATGKASIHQEKGRTRGLSFIFYLLEQGKAKLLLMLTVLALVLAGMAAWSWVAFVIAFVSIPLFGAGVPLAYLIYRSRTHDAGPADWTPYLDWKGPKAEKHKGKKVPMETMYEAYMAGELDFTQDPFEVLLKRNQIFSMAFTNNDLKFYLKDMLGQNLGHSIKADEGDIAHVYNRGNDFYNWFLGETMVYTSGIFRDRDETLEQGQLRKLDTVCKYVQMKPGDKHLDLGCGWGTLVAHAAKNFGTDSTGVTLAQEQA